MQELLALASEMDVAHVPASEELQSAEDSYTILRRTNSK
jgi:hypothetical protein